jgi:hypothetical protein
MLMHDPAGECFAWLVFSLVVCWSLRQGLPEFARWVDHNSDARGDLYFFPDDIGDELGKECSPGQEKRVTRPTSAAAGQVAPDRWAMSVDTEIYADVTNLPAEALVVDEHDATPTAALR